MNSVGHAMWTCYLAYFCLRRVGPYEYTISDAVSRDRTSLPVHLRNKVHDSSPLQLLLALAAFASTTSVDDGKLGWHVDGPQLEPSSSSPKKRKRGPEGGHDEHGDPSTGGGCGEASGSGSGSGSRSRSGGEKRSRRGESTSDALGDIETNANDLPDDEGPSSAENSIELITPIKTHFPIHVSDCLLLSENKLTSLTPFRSQQSNQIIDTVEFNIDPNLSLPIKTGPLDLVPTDLIGRTFYSLEKPHPVKDDHDEFPVVSHVSAQFTIAGTAGQGVIGTCFRGNLSTEAGSVIAKVIDLDKFDDNDTHDDGDKDEGEFEMTTVRSKAVKAIRDEFNIFHRLSELQGSLIPKLHGVFVHRNGRDKSMVYAMLMEDVGEEVEIKRLNSDQKSVKSFLPVDLSLADCLFSLLGRQSYLCMKRYINEVSSMARSTRGISDPTKTVSSN